MQMRETLSCLWVSNARFLSVADTTRYPGVWRNLQLQVRRGMMPILSLLPKAGISEV